MRHSVTLDRIRNTIAETGASIREVADQSGVSFSTIARALRGEGSLSPRTDAKLRRWLGDTVPELPETIPMPQSRAHAEMMLLVAERYLKDNQS